MASAAIAIDSRRYNLSQLSDADVLAGTRRLVGASNQLFADLLAHLAEVETRGIHRTKACTSLYTYCIYELQFSEDAAFRRVSAARFVKAFPALFDAVASGELHLTGLLMIAPHLTASNQHEVLARAKHLTKKELAKLVRELDPLPDVPPRIAPLGPAPEPRNHLRNPTWAEYVASMEPVRHLKPGERPSEWVDESTIAKAFEQSANDVAPARVSTPVTGPMRHSIQFTASQEYADLVERAKALLSHTGGTSLEELHLRAMQCLVAQLEKKKYGAPRGDMKSQEAERQPSKVSRQGAAAPRREREVQQVQQVEQAPSASDQLEPVPEVTDTRGPSARATAPTHLERSRCIPARIRRRVFERDGLRCTFVDESGCRCREVDRLELHHLKPFARDGQHHADNLTLRCAAHNALAAEQDFGREPILKRREAMRHESLRSQHGSGEAAGGA
jgi:5-methylcytosine-specific restriction endonuclease McrA